MRYIGAAFVGLALLLVSISLFSYLKAREVKQEYSLLVAREHTKQQLVNELLKNKEHCQNLLRANVYTQGSQDTLHREFRQVYVKNQRTLSQLAQILQDPRKKVLVQGLQQEWSNYKLYSDTLLTYARQDTAQAHAYLRHSIAPFYIRHQQLLIRLNELVSETAQNQTNEAIGAATSIVNIYAIFLTMAFAAVLVVAYMLRRVFRQLYRENQELNSEVSERQLLQQELEQSRQQYRNLFDRNPIPMWVYDHNTLRFLDVNAAAVKEYGYTRQEFLQMSLLDIRPQEEIPAFRDKISRTDEQEDAFSTGFRHKHKGGTLFKVELRSHALPKYGNICPRLVVSVNVQQRDEALERLQKNEKQLREISDSLPGAVYQYEMDKSLRFSFPFISEGVRKLFGISPADVYASPKHLFKTIHPEDLEQVQVTTLASYDSLKNWECEYRVWHAQKKRYIWVRGHSIPTKKSNGSVLWNGTFIDITKQREAQELLKRSKANLSALLDSSSQSVYLLDEHLRVITFNSDAAQDVRRLLLKNLEQGQSMLDYVAEEQLEEVRQNHTRAMQGETVEYETGFGEYWHNITYRPVADQNGKTISVALIIKDISQQKRAIETIRKNEMQLARAQQMARLGYWEYNAKQDLLHWTMGTFRIFGRNPELHTPTFHNTVQSIYPDDRNLVLEAWQTAVNTHTPMRVEHRILTPGGKVRHLMEIAEFVYDSTGHLEKAIGTVQDITERKRAEQEVLEAKNMLQNTLENIPEIVFTAAPDLTIDYISPQCRQITGYPEEYFVGKSFVWLRAMRHNERMQMLETVIPNVLQGEQQECELHARTRTGKYCYLLLRLSPKLSRKGKIIRIYGSATDITQYKKAEQTQQKLTDQLLRQNQNLQQFAYIVSHNMRAPIANMLGLVSIYDRQNPLAPINGRVVDNLHKSAQLLDTTIRDLNDLLTLRSQVDAVRELVDLQQIADEVLAALEQEITDSQACVLLNFDRAPSVQSVRSYTYSILYNLISNAIKYRKPDTNPEIFVTSSRLNGYICLSVRDNGLGIDLEAQRGKVFGLYKRFHHNIEGKGIGLHLVKTQAELLGGKVDVESKPQHGTTFTVYFKTH